MISIRRLLLFLYLFGLLWGCPFVFSTSLQSGSLNMSSTKDEIQKKAIYTIQQYTGRPTLFRDNVPLATTGFFNSTWDVNQVVDKQFSLFSKAGIHLQQIEVKLDWNPALNMISGIDNQYFDNTDKRIRAILKKDPQAVFLLRVHLFVPPSWEQEHPNDIVQTEDGTKMVSHKVCVSYASQTWRKEVSNSLKSLISELKNQSYYNKIAGFILFWGWSGEWNHWNPTWGPQLPPDVFNKLRKSSADYSSVMQDAFREYLKRKYINDPKALRKSWNNSAVTFKTASIPAQTLLTEPGSNRIRVNPHKAQAWDYIDCYASEVANAAGELALSLKTTAPEKLCGLFAGEILFAAIGGSTEIQRSGHLCFDRIIRDPNIDFLVTPNFYPSVQKYDGAAGLHLLHSSAQFHGKFLFYEYDQATFQSVKKQSVAKNWIETESFLTRDFAWAMIHGCGIWWWDMERQGLKKNCWYEDYRFRDLFQKFSQTEKESLSNDRSSRSEIAVVVDTLSLEKMNGGNTTVRELLLNQMDRLSKIGAPFDLYSIKDLKKTSSYRMIVFIDCLYINNSDREYINQKLKCDAHTLVWVCSAGLPSEENNSTDFMSQLSGFTLKRLPQTIKISTQPVVLSGKQVSPNWKPFSDTGYLNPAFVVNDPDAIIWGNDSSNNIPTVAMKITNGCKSFFISSASVSSDLLRQIAICSGVHIYVQQNDPVVVNAHYFSIFITSKGDRHISLPQSATVWDLMNSKLICKEKKYFTLAPEHIPYTYILRLDF